MEVYAAIWRGNALLQNSLPTAMILAASAAPQASLAQSRMPKAKSWLAQRQLTSLLVQPREGAWASMLFTQACCGVLESARLLL